MSKNLTDPVVTDDGSKVLKGSLRPDGTVRRDRRIRAGYTPQEEQPVYQSKGTLAKQNVPKCPGMDDDEIEALKQQALKGKKAGGQSSSTPSAKKPASNPAPAKPAATRPDPPKPPASSAAAQPSMAPEDPAAQAEKQVRALRKKLRQCEELEQKREQGGVLDKEQEEKLAKASAWRDEVAALEAQLKSFALATS